jgi:hypothetical protein
MSNSHLRQRESCSWCMWPKVHIMDVDVCSTHVSQVEEVYMNSIKVKVHYEINLWQAQGNMVGTSKWRWTDDPRQFLMIPKMSPTWIRSIRKALGAYIKIWHFIVNHQFMVILMMPFVSKMQVKWMGFRSLSPYGSKYFRNFKPCSNLVTMGLFLWMPCLATIMWSTTYSHWWCLIFITQECELLKLLRVSKHVKIWWSGWMPYKQNFKLACATLETIMFHCGWCPIGTPSIVVDYIFLKKFIALSYVLVLC